ncbi:hypothetical protein S7711_11484 [Stachybotrys chartarum IBT 7711]|uniref:Uncharacterized protein n=1 Tax=Stachybotrys chartarum (strain CBS 109288 / IBT 7711) TaxID=1280523 RepID=A0A084AZT4_STACB|nr:hypothetical protein S7711_11484 [Stachybotrys chartarum IBT 7711]
MDEFRNAIDKIAEAAKKASVGSRRVFVGLGGMELRPDLIELFAKRHSNIRFAMSGRDISTLAAGMAKQAAAMHEMSTRIRL